MNDHGARHHARFPASSAHRWIPCTASINYTANLPETTSDAAEEGRIAHEYLEQVLNSEIRLERIPTDEVRDAVAIVLDEIEEFLVDGWALYSEQYGEYAKDAGGTVDISLLRKDHRALKIIDFKYGKRVVEVVGNRQLLAYAAVMIQHFTAVDEIELIIVQPRAFHQHGPVRRWAVTREDVAKFLEEAANAMFAADHHPQFKAGEHCRYCKAEAVCPEFERAALAVASESFSTVQQVDKAVLPAPEDIPNDRLAHILNASAVLDEWLKAVERVAYARLRQGHQVPGWKLVEAKGRRKWDEAVEPETIADALATLGGGLPGDFLRVTPIGITEAERKLKAAVRETAQAIGHPKAAADQMVRDAVAYAAQLMDRGSSGNLTLVRDTDARPAKTPVGDAFTGVTIEHAPAQEPAPVPPWPGAQMLHGDDGLNAEDYIE